jgi:hypothetical protein
MATNQQKAAYLHMMEALGSIEGLLRKMTEKVQDPPLRSEAEASLRTCRAMRQIVQSTFSETERRAVGQLAAEAAQAMEEIERRPRPDLQLKSRPTFVLGSRRSGTTLLAWLLDSHPGLAMVPENLLSHLLFGESESSPLEIYERPVPLVRAYADLADMGETRQRFLGRIAQLVDGIFSDYAARMGKKRWVEKELFIPRSLDLLDAIFGYKAQYIYVVRHGLDAAFSASERFGWRQGTPLTRESSHNLRNYLRFWVDNNERFADFYELNEERCLLVRYEDLVTQPEPVARRIFEFLGEPWHPTIFEDMQRLDHHYRLGDNKIQALGGARIDPNRRERWKSWPPALVRQLGRMADQTLMRLGYPPLAAEEQAPPLAAADQVNLQGVRN